MTAPFFNVHGAFIGPDQDLARSLSSLDVLASKPFWQHPETGCGDLKSCASPSSLTGLATPTIPYTGKKRFNTHKQSTRSVQ